MFYSKKIKKTTIENENLLLEKCLTGVYPKNQIETSIPPHDDNLIVSKTLLENTKVKYMTESKTSKEKTRQKPRFSFM